MLVQFGKSARRAITFAVVLTMMLGSLAVPSATMAQSQSVQSSLTGVTVSYDAPYQIFEDGSYADDAMETMMFVGPADILAMGFMTPLIDINGARDIMLEALFGEMGSASTIDRGDYTGVSYSLDMLNIDGQEMGVFSLFMNQRSHGYAEFYIFIAPPTLFGSSMQTAQNSFTIDGTPLMDGVDPMVMGDMVTANIGITGGDAVTDVTDVAEPDTSANTSETDTTETTTMESTEVAETESSAGDADAYVGSVQDHRLEFFSSLSVFNENASGLSGDPTQDEVVVLFQNMTTEANFWVGFSATAEQLAPPAGYESAHEAYLAWAGHITQLGNLWHTALETGTEADFNAFFEHMNGLQALDDNLQAELTAASDQGSSDNTATESTETVATEEVTTETEESSSEGETSSRTTRSTNASDGDEAENESETSSRTTRSTNASGGDEAENESETSSRTTRSTNASGGDEAENESETSSRTTRSTNASEDDEVENESESETSSRTTRSTGESDDDDNESETSGRPSRSDRSSTDTDEADNSSETSGRTTRGGTDTSATDLPNEWLTDAHGVSITWSDDFALSDHTDEPQWSDPDSGQDTMYLMTTTPSGDTVRFSVSVLENPSGISSPLIDSLVDDPAAAEDIWGVGTELQDYNLGNEASAALLQAEDEIGGYWIFVQVTCLNADCSTVALLEINTEGTPLVDSLNMIESGVAVEGVSISSAMPATDVESVVQQVGD